LKIQYLAHASFLMTSELGTRIITDPYTVDENIRYDPINESADIVTMSHGHGDHNNSKAVKGKPQVIREAGKNEINKIGIRGIDSFHDEAKGAKRGRIVIFCFSVDGLNICHLGDLGVVPDQKEAAAIGPVDVLLIPVGGFFTIDAAQATSVVEIIKPRIVIPMHYKTAKVGYPIAPVDEFLKGKRKVKKINGSEIEIRKDSLPKETEVTVLQTAK
jgi:L-ascorbate metabolism protein UlaG (beta-lactamase superfamily)